ncbi:MAG TPA: enoyl-CoA hydratase/isomerase family protein, partial [Acidimicrobiales bacterium]
MDSYDTLLYEERDGVAIVTLNRPDVLNAFNRAMQADLRDVWRSLRGNDDVHAVILTGTGEKAFCTGIDRTETMGEAAPQGERLVGSGSTPFMFDDPGAHIGPKSCDL